ncbi:PAS domain S-box protein [Roseomonas sp. KE2513]|uniref:PAS domain S-box protein n=1 Tax=Roseomonas sp. KE2513 TaxID=2479202 RepID=UPI0018E00F2A|nr:PAS domain S-box protein [Roseomonas sp. KE2513]MBI0539514.1 PAS domain S-box protein [Roseomonas sp. KE2513]
MAKLIRSHDWAVTPLGPSATWPQPLRTVVEVMLASPMLASLAIGPERVFLYNDEAARHYGDRHPDLLGRPLADAFAHEFEAVEPFYDRVLAGESVHVPTQPLDPSRTGTTELFDAYLVPVHGVDGVVIAALMTGFAIGDRLLAEARLRDSEERQAFLLQLSDKLRPLADPAEIKAAAANLLGEQLAVNRAFYAEADGSWWLVAAGYENAIVALPDGPFAMSEYGDWIIEDFRAGDRLVVDDMTADPRFGTAEREANLALGIVSVVALPLVKNGQLVAMLTVQRSQPHRWSPVELLLVGETAERTWSAVERARAEAALRESEEKYRTVFESMDEGFLVHEMIRDKSGQVVDYRLLQANPAYQRATGLARETIGKLGSEFMPEVEPYWLELFHRVSTSGVTERVEMCNAPTSRWYNVQVSPVHGHDRIALVFDDVTTRKHAEAALRESESRHAFLLTLGDALRAAPTADEKIASAARELGERLEASRVLWAEYDWQRNVAHIFSGWFADGAQSFPTVMQLDEYDGEVLDALREGRTVRVDNVGLLVDKPAYAAIADVGVQALLSVPLILDGILKVNISVHQHEPRHWTDAEVALVREVAERLWAEVVRARAEAALRDSEERFVQFARASAAGLWIRNAATLEIEFVSPAVAAIYGVGAGALLGDVTRWAALIVPDDRDVALGHLEAARHGDIAVHEFRIQRPSDGAFRWIRNTVFPLRDNGHIPRVGGIFEDVTEAKLAAERSAVLLAELQHRVRNIMALLRSITNRTGDRAESVPEYRDLMMGRLLAFARVQALLTRTANVSIGIASIVHDEVSVQAQHEGQYLLDGPDVALSPKASEVLTLAIHELATNAVKYGAFSAPAGRVTVRWSTFEKRGRPWLTFDWTEEGAPARPLPAPGAPARRGFGSELIEGRIPYELRGRGQVTIEPGGAQCHLEFPLQDGASILETGAPQRATVFGGAIDMTGEADLTGRSILVVEDDYYLAADTARALRGAGAEVLGPCATEEDARAELDEQRPDAVVVDINLGPGPSFKLAETLKDAGIPFVFTTGYDAEVIPAEFEAAERLQKPLQLREIVSAVARLTTAA